LPIDVDGDRIPRLSLLKDEARKPAVVAFGVRRPGPGFAAEREGAAALRDAVTRAGGP
jgi:hypothetical protein